MKTCIDTIAIATSSVGGVSYAHRILASISKISDPNTQYITIELKKGAYLAQVKGKVIKGVSDIKKSIDICGGDSKVLDIRVVNV